MMELMISIGVLAVLLLSVVAIFTSLINSSTKGADLATGCVVADAVLGQHISDIKDDVGVVARSDFFDPTFNSPPQPPIQGTRVLNGTTFTYNIYYETVDDLSTGGTLGASLTNNTTKKVDIILWWWDGQRQGYGTLRVDQTRLVNEVAPD